MGNEGYSNRYEGMELCSIDDVIDEIGPVVSKQSSTVFPDERRNQIIGRWCSREQSKFFAFVEIKFYDLKGDYLEMARDAVLFRVVIRVLRKIQANRTQRAGGVPTYQSLIDVYQQELDMIEHHIRTLVYPQSKDKDGTYPPTFSIKVTAQDDTDDTYLPGARVYVNNQWISTTWKDGEVVVPLQNLGDSEEPYDIIIKMVGYVDSDVQEVDEVGTYNFRLTPTP